MCTDQQKLNNIILIRLKVLNKLKTVKMSLIFIALSSQFNQCSINRSELKFNRTHLSLAKTVLRSDLVSTVCFSVSLDCSKALVISRVSWLNNQSLVFSEIQSGIVKLTTTNLSYQIKAITKEQLNFINLMKPKHIHSSCFKLSKRLSDH